LEKANEGSFMNCTACGKKMSLGFMYGHDSLRIMPADRVTHWAHSNIGCDLSNAPFWKKIFPHRSSYVPCHHCEACGLVTIDYKTVLSSEQAKQIARDEIAASNTDANS
jgi:hypothetical protein